jgi:chromosome segregation ATPase
MSRTFESDVTLVDEEYHLPVVQSFVEKAEKEFKSLREKMHVLSQMPATSRCHINEFHIQDDAVVSRIEALQAQGADVVLQSLEHEMIAHVRTKQQALRDMERIQSLETRLTLAETINHRQMKMIDNLEKLIKDGFEQWAAKEIGRLNKLEEAKATEKLLKESNREIASLQRQLKEKSQHLTKANESLQKEMDKVVNLGQANEQLERSTRDFKQTLAAKEKEMSRLLAETTELTHSQAALIQDKKRLEKQVESTEKEKAKMASDMEEFAKEVDLQKRDMLEQERKRMEDQKKSLDRQWKDKLNKVMLDCKDSLEKQERWAITKVDRVEKKNESLAAERDKYYLKCHEYEHNLDEYKESIEREVWKQWESAGRKCLTSRTNQGARSSRY